jgi:hypothetical protein
MQDPSLPSFALDAAAEFQGWWVDSRDNTLVLADDKLPLYHYTDARGLMGMVSTEEIWLTSILYLNDPGEFSYGMSLARDMMKERLEKEHPIIQAMLALMIVALNETKTFTSLMGLFVASFSSNGDELEQWRAYGDNGRGFSVGVSSKVFKQSDLIDRAKRPPNELIFMSRVIYDEAIAIRRQRDVVDKLVEIAARLVARDALTDDPGSLNAFYVKMLDVVISALVWNSLTTKHPAYRNEQETRLILLNESVKLGPYIKTRVRGSDIVPYIPYSIDLRGPGAIGGIVVGPAAAPQAEHAVKCLFDGQEIDPGDVIKRSKVPYRS